MIELNLTYEESKKILELGYDFSKVCCKFESRDYMGLSKFFVRLDDCLAIECDNEIDYINYNGLRNWCESYKMGTFTVPLIPKAALEACLPTIILDTEQGRIYYLSFDGNKTPNYRYQHETLDGIRTTYTDYKSALEAFLWVHENYPEELKNKFDEVMG
jgi:hypothetical protein